jgi:hypothetical protein
MFKIIATDKLVPDSLNGRSAFYGRIVLDGFEETFAASLVSWSRDDYDRHWKKALEHLVAGADRSALITDYVEPPMHPNTEDYLVWWPLYRDGDNVYVQNQILFFKQLGKPFLPARPWDSVRDRQLINGDGQSISEWPTTVKDIRQFLS